MPMFTLLLAGAADFARFAYASIEVSNAARAGVQYGMQSATTAMDTAGMAQAATNDGADVSSLKATASASCVCTDGTSITCANAATKCVAPARILQYVQVNTTAALNPLFQYPGLPTTLTLNGQASARVEQ
jgi:Flp pilus assembly protein TadG